MHPRLVKLLVFLLVLTFGCESAPATSSPEITLLSVDTLISTESGLLSQPAAMVVGSDGTLHVLDGQSAQVHRVSPDGDLLPPIGSAGEGPGEFQRPLPFR